MKLDNRQSPWRKRIDRYVGIPLVVLAALLRRVLFLKYWGGRATRKRVLVIKLSALGDVVLMLPALYRLRESYKDAELVFLGGSSNVEFLKLCSAVDRVESFSFGSCMGLLKGSYDLVVDFDQWIRATAILSGLCVSRQISGFKTQNHLRHFAYDHIQPFNRSEHMAKNFWNLAQSSLAKAGRKPPGSFESDRETVRREWVPRLISSVKTEEAIKAPYSIIHPGCGENGQMREWPLESWKNLLQSLRASNKELILITGKGPHEKEWGDRLASGEGVVSMVDKLNLRELIMTLFKARSIIAGNTGIMHLADYLNDSVFVLEGPTDSALWGPLWKGKNILSPLACSPCLTWGHDYGCSDPVCLKAITPKQVFKAMECLK